jgi:hypothetical protein
MESDATTKARPAAVGRAREPHREEGGERKHPHRQVEPRPVVEEEMQDPLRRVGRRRGGLVGAEEGKRRAPAGALGGDGEEDSGAEEAVEPGEGPDRAAEPAMLDEAEQQGRRPDRREERDGLSPRLECERTEGE